MADIRIKDLTTEVSSTATGDFFVIDGTTGTRRTPAFNPTFGGNATVTGTLTSNGSFVATGSMSSTYGADPQFSIAPSGGRPIRFNASLGNMSIQANSGGWFLGTKFLGSAGTLRGNIWAAGTDDTLDSINIGDGSFSQWIGASSTKIAIPLTTPSTTTSSGALVVGNGTSGGLGVGGDIRLGGSIFCNTGAGFNTPQWLVYQSSTSLYIRDTTNAAMALQFVPDGSTPQSTFYGRINANSTTASTSTSSGALVVSGGVGVAGKVNATSVGVANTSQSVAAWGDVGIQLSVAGAVLTDTSSSGTVARIVTNSIASSALAASSTTTYTAAATLFIAGGPTANTNVTITNAYAIYTAAGRINFQGLPTSSAGLQAGTLWNDGGTLKVA